MGKGKSKLNNTLKRYPVLKSSLYSGPLHMPIEKWRSVELSEGV